MLLPGHNDNIKYNGVIYHVQTETRGTEESPYVVSLVFVDGRIIYRRKTEWLGSVDNKNELGQFRELLDEQHADVIIELKSNTLQRASADEQEKIEMDEKKLIARFLDEWADN